MNNRTIGAGVALFILAAGGTMLAMGQPGRQPGGQPAGQIQGKGDSETADEEEVITLDKAPGAVRAAALKLAGDAKNITKVIKEEDEEDVVTFEVEYNDGAVKCAAVFSTAGELMETERATTEARLPAAVMAALRKDFPKATFADPQVVTRMFYEIDVVIDGKKHEVKVDAAGNIEDESDGDQEHGNHAKGEEHGKGEKHEGKRDDDD